MQTFNWIAFGMGKHFHFISVNRVCVSLGETGARCLLCFTHLAVAIRSRRSLERVSSLLGKPGSCTTKLLQHLCPLLRIPTSIWMLTWRISGRLREWQSSFKDALLQHVKRSIYRAGIWASSNDHQQNIPSPYRFGWKKKDGFWVPVWLTLPEVSRSCRELVKCSCKAQCSGCKCAKASLPSTDLCKCKCSKWLICNVYNHSIQFPTVEMRQLLSFFVLHHREIVRHVCLLYSYSQL